MSDSNYLAQIRSITLSKSREFLDMADKDGTYSKEVENGVVLTLTLEKGKLVKFAAQNNNGDSLKTFRLKMEDYPGGVADCYICYGGDYGQPGTPDGPYCTTMPCRWM